MVTAFLLAACAQPQVEGEAVLTGTNPIITGQFTADPTARVFEGKIYMYPSHDIPSVITHTDGSAWFSMPDYHVFSSEDLTLWTDHGVILRQEDVPWGKPDAYAMLEGYSGADAGERRGSHHRHPFPHGSRDFPG